MIQTILEKVFGRKINVRMREGFFPFTVILPVPGVNVTFATEPFLLPVP